LFAIDDQKYLNGSVIDAAEPIAFPHPIIPSSHHLTIIAVIIIIGSLFVTRQDGI